MIPAPEATRSPRLVWRKLSSAQWEDAWQERLGWLGQRLVIVLLGNFKTLRIEAYQLTQAEAEALQREFGGSLRPDRPLTPAELQPQPRPPLRIRGRLIIFSETSQRPQGDTPSLHIPASLAFGTGDHATTATCLRLLADIAHARRDTAWEALDLGTGTGILAFAALRLGARRVEAGDFDPAAVRVARANARLNGIRCGIKISRFDVLDWRPERRWPLVMANVYSPILIAAARQITAAIEPGGHLILSGILREQAAEVIAAYQARGLQLQQHVQRGKWATLLAQRPARSSGAR